MKKEEYLDRIAKCEVKVEKIQKRIAKWSSGMNNEAQELAKAYGLADYDTRKSLYAEYKAYKNDHSYDATVFNPESWNKGPHMDELMHAYSDLKDVLKTIENYKTKVSEIDNFENESKIEVIVKFLEDWRKKAYDWHIENIKKYLELKKGYSEALNKHLSEVFKNTEKPSYWEKYSEERRFDEEYYAGISALTRNLCYGHSKFEYVDLNKLDMHLNEEVKRKYKDLVYRITSVVGVIKNAAGLSIGEQNGEINGYVSGDKGSCWVETISAGGYNIQCFHYRVLVKKIRE